MGFGGKALPARLIALGREQDKERASFRKWLNSGEAIDLLEPIFREHQINSVERKMLPSPDPVAAPGAGSE